MRIVYLFLGLFLVMANVVYADSASQSQKEEPQLENEFKAGIQFLQARQHEDAIKTFSKIQHYYESTYNKPTTRYYCARSQPEAVFYLMSAPANGQKATDALAVSPEWSYAYFYQAFALIDMGRPLEAKPFLEKAIALAPANAQFLNELGHIQQLERKWTESAATFLKVGDAITYSPDPQKLSEQTRALRGLGYAYVEQGRLREAKQAYEQCLELDPQDKAAAGEIDYINSKLKK